MKAYKLVYKLARVFLMIVIMGGLLTLPIRSTSAKPLSTGVPECASVTQISQAECAALVALYNSTDGANWTDHTNWLQTNTPCSWHGVHCLDGLHVTKIYLYKNALTGPIPPELGDLIYLANLDLSSNQLTDSIPTELGKLTNLTDLYLGFNQLSGSIPPELGNLKKVTYLYLASNQLSGTIPPELGSMTDLDWLELFSNQLTGSIPPELGSLANLTELLLNHNQLTGPIPPELGNLTKLKWLALYSNQLSGEIPASITNLVNLEGLGFDRCNGLGSTNAAVIAFLDQKKPGWNDCGNRIISGNAGIGGAKLGYADGSPMTVTADANGNYSIPVTYFWSGTLTPSKAGFAFLPVNKSYTNVIADQTAQNFTASNSITVSSDAVQDGWVLESTEASKAGGSLNATDPTLRLGDDKTRKQYRSILSFDTGVKLPDNAVITSVTLKVKKHSITGGGDPLTTFQGFMVDIKKGIFGTTALQTTDFQTAATKSIGPVSPALASGWYRINLTSGKASINKQATSSGLTQIRLRFNLDDNNNAIANYLSLFSGNAPAASRPQLVIQYTVP